MAIGSWRLQITPGRWLLRDSRKFNRSHEIPLEIDGFSSISKENPRISLNIPARPASAELGRPASRCLDQPAESQPEAGAQKSRFPVLPSSPDPWAPWMSFLVHTFQRRPNRTMSFVLEGSDGIVEKSLLNILH